MPVRGRPLHYRFDLFGGRHRSFWGTNVVHRVRPVPCNRVRGNVCWKSSNSRGRLSQSFRENKTRPPVQFRGPEVDSGMAGTSPVPRVRSRPVPNFWSGGPRRNSVNHDVTAHVGFDAECGLSTVLRLHVTRVRPLIVSLRVQSASSAERLRFPGKTDCKTSFPKITFSRLAAKRRTGSELHSVPD